MKDLGVTKQTFGTRITRGRSKETLELSQKKDIQKVLNRFNVQNVKPRKASLDSHLRLSKEQSPKSNEVQECTKNVPYASIVGSLIYVMMCTRPNITHTVGVMSRFMSNLREEH